MFQPALFQDDQTLPRASARQEAQLAEQTLLERLDALNLGCPPNCSCRGRYTGPERRAEHRPAPQVESNWVRRIRASQGFAKELAI